MFSIICPYSSNLFTSPVPFPFILQGIPCRTFYQPVIIVDLPIMILIGTFLTHFYFFSYQNFGHPPSPTFSYLTGILLCHSCHMHSSYLLIHFAAHHLLFLSAAPFLTVCFSKISLFVTEIPYLPYKKCISSVESSSVSGY